MMRTKSRFKIFEDIDIELDRAGRLFHNFHSNHEGIAVIKEEFDELWDEIKQHKGITATEAMEREAIQIAAMAVRFIEDLRKA